MSTTQVTSRLAFLAGDKVSRPLEQEDIDLIARWPEQFGKFRQFCLDHSDHETFEESDFNDLSLGFFIALGVIGEAPKEPLPEDEEDMMFYDAAVLGTLARYVFQYWNWA